MFLELAMANAVAFFSSIKQKHSAQSIVFHLHGSLDGECLSSVVAYVICT